MQLKNYYKGKNKKKPKMKMFKTFCLDVVLGITSLFGNKNLST